MGKIPFSNFNKWIDDKMNKTAWIWLPFHTFLRLLMEIAASKKKK